MEKNHRIELYDYTACKICFRKIGFLVSFGDIIITSKGEFAGHLNGDTIIASLSNNKLQVIYHCKTIELIELQFGLRGIKPKTYDFSFRMNPLNLDNFIDKMHWSLDKEYAVTFIDVYSNEEEALKILQRNGDLFKKPTK